MLHVKKRREEGGGRRGEREPCYASIARGCSYHHRHRHHTSSRTAPHDANSSTLSQHQHFGQCIKSRSFLLYNIYLGTTTFQCTSRSQTAVRFVHIKLSLKFTLICISSCNTYALFSGPLVLLLILLQFLQSISVTKKKC